MSRQLLQKNPDITTAKPLSKDQKLRHLNICRKWNQLTQKMLKMHSLKIHGKWSYLTRKLLLSDKIIMQWKRLIFGLSEKGLLRNDLWKNMFKKLETKENLHSQMKNKEQKEKRLRIIGSWARYSRKLLELDKNKSSKTDAALNRSRSTSLH